MVFSAALLAHLPMLAEWAKNMWNKEHYQYFPIVVSFISWRLMQAWLAGQTAGKPARGRRWALVLLTLDLAMVSLSALAFSPFLIIPALMLLIAAAFVAGQGWEGLQRAGPPCLLLVFVTPLPLNWDVELIHHLQFSVSGLASWMLDALGQIHFREGVVLVTAHHQFLAEEACSGIRSLFSSLSMMAIYGVTRGYGMGRQSFNQCQIVLWVLAGNGIRVAVIILVAEHWTMAIAEGAAHDALGLAVLTLIFLLALCTDRLLDLLQVQEVEQ